MGKRKGGARPGKDSKRQRCHQLVEPGQYGVYVTCARFKEVAAAKEMRVLLQEAIEKHYPKAEEDGEEAGEEQKAGSIEDEIAREIEELKKNDDRAKHNRNNKDLVMREVQLGVESLVFFKLRQPVKPSDLVVKMCTDMQQSGTKYGRFLQRIVAIDRSCNATEAEFVKLLATSISQYLEQQHTDKSAFTTYNVNLVKRNFDTISRDEFMALVQKELDTQFGAQWAQLRYKGATTLINIYCFKNNIGISVVPQRYFDSLSKFNVQQLFEKAQKEAGPEKSSLHSAPESNLQLGAPESSTQDGAQDSSLQEKPQDTQRNPQCEN